MDADRSDGGRAAGPGETLARPLRDLRARARRLLVAERVGVVAASAAAAAGALGLLDYLLRLPGGARGVALAAGVVALGWAVWRVVRPAVRFCPSLTDVALRAERAEPGLRGRLASGLEFAAWTPAEGERRGVGPAGLALARRASREAAALAARVSPRAVLRPERARRGLAYAGVAALALAGVSAAAPGAAGTAAARMLMPWGDASWPKRTAVADATGVEFAARGEALTLRAAAWRRAGDVANADVRVEWRETGGEAGTRAGGVTRELMTYQGGASRLGGASVAGPRDAGEGGVFEKPVRSEAGAIEYRFVSADDRTRWRRVRLEPRPRVVGASAEMTPPAYAAGVRDERTADLGGGDDERAAAPEQLAGTAALLRVRTNKPARALVSVVQEEGGGRRELDLRASRAATSAGASAGAGDSTASVEVPLELDGRVRVEVELIDEHGLASSARSVYRFEGRPDRAPSATVVDPPRDLTVLATAAVPFAVEGRDDVALRRVAMERRVWRPAGSGTGGRASLEPAGAGVIAAQASAGGGERSARAAGEVALATLLGGAGVGPGDRVELVAIAADLRAPDGPFDAFAKDAATPPGVTRSRARVLRVVDEPSFVEELRRSLDGVREGAKRIDAQQQTAAGLLDDRGPTAGARREQSEIGERAARQREAVRAVRERVRMNRLDDERLRELLNAASEGLERAGDASRRASEAMSDAAGAEEGSERRDAATARAKRAQREVRDALSEVVARLDRGEDDWVVRNQLERAAREQRELERRTGEVGRGTAGREAEELSESEREALSEIDAAQRELAERTGALLEEMRERAERLDETDPVASRALEEAARNAQRSGVEDAMRRAAESVGENRTNEARQEQRRAAEALERALDDMDAGERAQNEVLRRILASVEQTLEGLVEDQRAEIAALDAATEGGEPLAPLANNMITLNRNTLAAGDQLRSGGPRLLPALNLLIRAGAAQEEAIGELRSVSPDAEAARTAERRSLAQLESALEFVRETDEDIAEEERRRLLDELREAYAGHLGEVEAVAASLDEFGEGRDIGRRERAELRRLARRVRSVVEAMAGTGEAAGRIEGAIVIEYAHRRATRALERAESALGDAAPASAGDALDRAAATLRGIVETLREPEPTEDRPFEGGGGGGGGGSGGGGGAGEEPAVPPAQQLRLLRMIQADVAARTRELDAEPVDGERTNLRELAEEQRELSRVGRRLMEQVMEGRDLGELFSDTPAEAEDAGTGDTPGGGPDEEATR